MSTFEPGWSGVKCLSSWYQWRYSRPSPNRNSLETPSVFAGLLTVILIGLVVESVIFRTIENMTVRRWGMQS